MLPLVLMFVVLYFVMIRPQMKRQKEHRAMIDALAKGDEVATAGGMLGRVVDLDEQFLHHRDRCRRESADPAQRRGPGAAQGHGQVSTSRSAGLSGPVGAPACRALSICVRDRARS